MNTISYNLFETKFANRKTEKQIYTSKLFCGYRRYAGSRGAETSFILDSTHHTNDHSIPLTESITTKPGRLLKTSILGSLNNRRLGSLRFLLVFVTPVLGYKRTKALLSG